MLRDTAPTSVGSSHSRSLLLVVLVDVEVAQLVRALVWGDDTKEITELLLLQVLLGKVLQVALRERRLGLHLDLGLLARHLDLLAEVTGLALNLDALLQVLLEVTW